MPIVIIKAVDTELITVPHKDLSDDFLATKYLKGYIVDIRDSKILGASESLPNFVVVDITDATVADCMYLKSMWHREIDVTTSVVDQTASITEFNAVTNPNTKSTVTQRGYTPAAEINYLLSIQDVPLTVKTVVDDQAVFDMQVVDSKDESDKIKNIKRQAEKVICCRRYRVKPSFVDTVSTYMFNNNKPMPVLFNDFKLEVIDRASEI